MLLSHCSYGLLQIVSVPVFLVLSKLAKHVDRVNQCKNFDGVDRVKDLNLISLSNHESSKQSEDHKDD